MTHIVVVRQPSNKNEYEQINSIQKGVLDSKLELQKNNEKKYFIAILDKKVVGTATLFKNKDESGCWIEKVAVLEDFQGKKIGRDLLHFVEWYARKFRCKSIKINIFVSSLGFFEKQGYQKISPGEKVMKDEEFFLIEKNL